jgi:hypothetical protein
MAEGGDPEVWATVARTPALMQNIDNSAILVQETNALVSTVTKHQSEFTSALASRLKKRVKQLEKSAADCGPNNSVGKAILCLRETIDLDVDALEKEAKSVESSVADALGKLGEAKAKQKAEFDAELDKKKKINENMKAQVIKKRKEALKEYDALQDEMKKVVEKRDLLQKEADPKKKEKIKKSQDQAEAVVFKHKTGVRNKFREVETLVLQTNQSLNEYYFQWLPQYVLKLAQAEQDKGTQVKTCLQTFVAEQRKVIESMTANLNKLEESVNAIDSDADAQLFMQSAIPAGAEAPPPALQVELPIDSEKVETAANALLKAGMVSRTGSLQTMSSSGEFKSDDGGKMAHSADALDTTYEETGGGDEGYYEEKKYRAIYEYDNGGDATYANLKVGDIVIVNDFSDPTWWGGYFENDPDNLVWIPSEYVEEIQ